MTLIYIIENILLGNLRKILSTAISVYCNNINKTSHQQPGHLRTNNRLLLLIFFHAIVTYPEVEINRVTLRE